MLHTDANKDVAQCAGVDVFADDRPPIVFRKCQRSVPTGWDHTIYFCKGRSVLRLYVHQTQGKARGAESKLYNLSSSLDGSLVSADMVGLPSHVVVRDHISDQR
jgi:hypothetical protein